MVEVRLVSIARSFSLLMGALLGIACTPANAPRVISTGSLELALDGVPTDVAVAVHVSNGLGFTKTVSSSVLIGELTPADYTIQADTAQNPAGDLFAASTPVQTVNVPASETPADATISYAQISGSLVVTVAGMPTYPVQATPVRITGPGNFDQAIGTTTTYRGLTPGTYTIVGADLGGRPDTMTSIEPYEYRAMVPQQTVVVTASATSAEAVITYAAVTAGLTVEVIGLPPTVVIPDPVTINGPDSFTLVTQRTVIRRSLAPGTYTILAKDVFGPCPNVYTASPTAQTITISAGVMGTATVKYTATMVPMP